MAKFSTKFTLLCYLTATAFACGDDHDHLSHIQKRTSPRKLGVTPPTVPLNWGDINIIHTTDTHGWLLGHQKEAFPEPNYSGTFGDFSSFVAHMKELAVAKDVDLLLVDTGDLHDGTGLTDGFPAGVIDAHDANELVKRLPYDILAIGNHELYTYNITLDMYQNFAPAFNGRYLSSNVNITVPDASGKPVSVPVGSRFAKFKTAKGRDITAFGVLYNFTGNDKNTTVQNVTDMVKQQWFMNAIADEPDFFLLAGHMPIQKDNWPVVFNAIRAVHPTTPIIILGGHTHIRDCVQMDGRSMSLESGRYMETVGWLSAKLDGKGSSGNITFSRRYLDPNRLTYKFHTGKEQHTFDTSEGQEIERGLKQLAEQYRLGEVFGTAPQDYFLSRAPYPSDNSLLSLFIEKAAPIALSVNNSRASIPNFVIANSGSQRFDIFQGPFTRDDQFEVSPFLDAFLYIESIPAGIAQKVLSSLNGAGANQRRAADVEHDHEDLEGFKDRLVEEYGWGYVAREYNAWLENMDKRNGLERRETGNLTLGYVTKDSCPGVGDDVIHAPMPYFNSPDFIGSKAPNVTDDAPIDLVFVDFIESQLLGILNKLQTTKNYTATDVKPYSPLLANQVLGVFAQAKWN